MSEADGGEMTDLLRRAANGEREVADRIFRIAHTELKRVARRQMRSERANHTLTPTALVNEAYLKLAGHMPEHLENRRHFVAIAARAMRQVLVSHAMTRAAAKRGGGVDMVTFQDSAQGVSCRADQVVELNQALEELAKIDVRLADVVEYRYFGGLSQAEIAATLAVSLSTVERDWRTARAWMRTKLGRA